MDEHNRYVVADPESPATRKQIAFLTYLKQVVPKRLTKGQAAKLIDSVNKGNADDRAHWISTRRILFPDLYYDEDVLELYTTLYSHIRNTMRAGSKKLTQKKIISVIDLLDRTQSGWDTASNSKQIFIAKLRELYPGCCDEKGQDREQCNSGARTISELTSVNNQHSRTTIIKRGELSQTVKVDSRGSNVWLWIVLLLLFLAGIITLFNL